MAGSRQPPRLEPTIAPLEQSPIYAHRTGAGEPTLAPEPAPRPDVRQDVRPDAARPQGNPARPFGSTNPLGGTGRPMGNPGSLGASRPLGNTTEPADRAFGAARPFGGAVEPTGAPFLGGSAHLARPPEHGLQAPYAADPAATRGRRHAEPAPEGRTEFQRDRDRIVHANAFRRLEYKTQVFINHEGDLFRTRLTHTLEVAQIARSVARTLRLNEDLTEAISLAHDLGHTPFGHAGQDELNACMMAHAPEAGGFEHNMQSLRVVDALEERYAAFDGLNLCFETREGILKHCSAANARKLGDLGVRFLERTQPSLEAQLANLSDEIAYNNHDIDDGLRSGLITLAQMRDVPMFARHYAMVERAYPDLPERRAITETIRRMINTLIVDLTRTTAERIASHSVRSADDVRAAPMLVAFSDGVRTEADQLKKFLMDNLYRHYKVMRVMNKAKRVVRELFEAFLQEPRLLPPAYQRKNGGDEQARAIADYIAGMTDRYAIREHRRLFMVGEDA